MMRFDPTNTEEVDYEQETDQIKYKKMFKIDENNQDEQDTTIVNEKIKGETVQTGYINGNNFVQLRIPKRYENNTDEFKELFEAKENKMGDSEEAKEQILLRENEIFLNWRRNLNQIETDMMKEFKDTLATKKDFLKYKMNKITP